MSAYDRFAWYYNKYWASGPNSFVMRALPILDRLLLSSLPQGARVLDLCCGNGQLAAELTKRGIEVTGIDASAVLLDYARQNAPGAEFLLADARTFALPATYHAVLSTFDSLNHILEREELLKVFANVSAALIPSGRFLFDLNMDAGYRARWRGSFGVVDAAHVCVVQSAYAPAEGLGQMVFTMFDQSTEGWQRSDITMFQHAYAQDEVFATLHDAGFVGTVGKDAETELGMAGTPGRMFFLTEKPSVSP
jgi:SAM-dependent methyltransferase